MSSADVDHAVRVMLFCGWSRIWLGLAWLTTAEPIQRVQNTGKQVINIGKNAIRFCLTRPRKKLRMQFLMQCGINGQIAKEIPERPPFEFRADVCQLISCPRKKVIRYCLTMVVDYAREA